MTPDKYWNRCDVCGRFIALFNFVEKGAVREMVTPDTHFTREEYETLCPTHAERSPIKCPTITKF